MGIVHVQFPCFPCESFGDQAKHGTQHDPLKEWRKPMNTTNFLRRARSGIMAALIASISVMAFPQTGLARSTSTLWDASDAGIWKVERANSQIGPSTATLTLERAGSVNHASTFMATSNGNVYLVKGAPASISNDLNRMKEGKALLIGTDARATAFCDYRCEEGFAEPHMTLTFNVRHGRQQQIANMLAQAEQN
jgi:hypothetical protein